MEKSIMEAESVSISMKHIPFFVTTITGLSEETHTEDWTGSVNERKGYTSSDSYSQNPKEDCQKMFSEASLSNTGCLECLESRTVDWSEKDFQEAFRTTSSTIGSITYSNTRADALD